MEIGDLVRAKTVRHYSDDATAREEIVAPKGTVFVFLLIGREELRLEKPGPSPDSWIAAGLGWAPPNLLTKKQRDKVKGLAGEANQYSGGWLKRLKAND